MPQFLTALDLADILSCSNKTIYARVKKGEIPYYKFGSSIRFDKKEIEKWIPEHKEK